MWITAPAPPLGACPPPDVATLGERGRADDFGRHPGVGAGGAHLGGAVPLAGQAKVRYLQGLVAQVLHLHLLQEEDWEGRGAGSGGAGEEQVGECGGAEEEVLDPTIGPIACTKTKNEEGSVGDKQKRGVVSYEGGREERNG